MDQKKLGKYQLIIGIIAILVWVLNTVITAMVTKFIGFNTNSITPLLFGLFAIITGYYNSKT